MIDIIRDIEISSVDDALNILKSIDTDGSLFEKAHNVGDLFFRDGKTYIYTEYAPGKYDWHLVKTKKVIRGKGINGKHGLNALKSVYSGLDKTFNDPDKMMLKRTPNGHWRLFYDDADAGTTIGGDTITESELKEDNVCYQDKRVVDNFELLKGYMEFNNPDDVYFVQIIKRWKDNKDKPDADAWRAAGRKKGSYHSGGEFLNYYLIHSNSELDSLKSEIIKACSYNNARAYISINSRSQNAVNAYMSKFKSRFTDPNDPRVKNAEAILYGQAKVVQLGKMNVLRFFLI